MFDTKTPDSTPNPRQKSSHQPSYTGKSKKSSKLKTRKTSTAQAAARMLGRIDKLELVLPISAMTEHELDQAGARLQAISLVTKLSAKGKAYLLNYVLRCPSGAKVAFNLQPSKPRMRFGMKITLNPDHMDEADTELFLQSIKRLFPLNGKAMVASLLLNRADQAFDHPVALTDLVIHLPGSPTESKFFVATDRLGLPQTWYCGSVGSPVHWLAYDQNASDAYKIAHGEVPSRGRRRAKPEDDAEFLAQVNRSQDRSRFEVRRVFATPLTLRQADALARSKPFGIVDIFCIDQRKLAGAPADFCLYVDSVKLHGVAGARSNFLRRESGKNKKQRLAEFEAYLADCGASFWDKAGLDTSIEAAPQHLLQHHREWECQKWMREHRVENAPWLAIDDTPQWFVPDCSRLLVTQSESGIQQHQVLTLRAMMGSVSSQSMAAK